MKQKKESFVGKIMNFHEDHKREFDLGGGIGFALLTLGFAIYAGVKVAHIVDDKKKKLEEIDEKWEQVKPQSKEDAENIDKQWESERREIIFEGIKEAAPKVLPAVVACGASITSQVMGYNDANKAIAGFATLSALATNSELLDYKEEAKALLGEKKEQEIQDNTNINKMKRDFENGGKANIISTGSGNALFYDKVTGQFFRADWNYIEKCVNRVVADWQSNRIDDDDYGCCLYSHFLEELGLPYDSTAANAFAWKPERDGRKEIQLKNSVGSVVYDDTKESATVVDFRTKPQIVTRYVV